MSVGQTGICDPHDLLQFPELVQEAGPEIIDSLSRSHCHRVIFALIIRGKVLVALKTDAWMGAGFHEPQRVGSGGLLVAGDFLLSKTPVGQRHLVTEQVASGQSVAQTKRCSKSTHSGGRWQVTARSVLNLDTPIIVCIAGETGETVAGDFVLEVGLCDGWSVALVRVESLGRLAVHEPDLHAVSEERDSAMRVLFDLMRAGRGHGHAVVVRRRRRVVWARCLNNEPLVVLVIVWVEGNLLLSRASGIIVQVRVQKSSLCVGVSDGDGGAQRDVCKGVLHAVPDEGVLEGRGHEAVAFARAIEDAQMHCKGQEVDEERDTNEAGGPCKEVPEDEGHWLADVAQVAPELHDGRNTDGSDGEETDPLCGDDAAEEEAASREPGPPRRGKGLAALLVAKLDPAVGGCGGEEDEERVEEDQAGLCGEGVVKEDHEGAYEGGGASQGESAKGEVCDGYDCDTQDGWKGSHRYVGHRRVFSDEVLPADVLEIKFAVETSQASCASDEEFCEGRVYVHEELSVDVLGSEATKVDLIEDDTAGLADLEEADKEGEDSDGGQEG